MLLHSPTRSSTGPSRSSSGCPLPWDGDPDPKTTKDLCLASFVVVDSLGSGRREGIFRSAVHNKLAEVGGVAHATPHHTCLETGVHQYTGLKPSKRVSESYI